MFILIFSLLQSALALDVYYGFEHALPADNATEVVTNIAPAILMTGETADEMLLTRASDGQEVPSSVTNYAGIYQLLPDADLETETTYILSIAPTVGTPEDGIVSTFTTGQRSDLIAPTRPTITNVERSSNEDEWGVWTSLIVTIDAAVDDADVRYAVELYFEPCGNVREEPTCGAPGQSAEGHFLPRSNDVDSHILRFSDDPAGNNHPGAHFEPYRTMVIVKAIDLAGNESAKACSVPKSWDISLTECADVTNVLRIANPEDNQTSGGCSVLAGATAPMGLGMTLLPLLGLRRRRSLGNAAAR